MTWDIPTEGTMCGIYRTELFSCRHTAVLPAAKKLHGLHHSTTDGQKGYTRKHSRVNQSAARTLIVSDNIISPLSSNSERLRET